MRKLLIAMLAALLALSGCSTMGTGGSTPSGQTQGSRGGGGY